MNYMRIYNCYSKSSFNNFMVKHNLYYLLLAILFYLAMWGLYTICFVVNTTTHYFNMEIDKHIPFVKYMLIFYYTHYFVPEILLWRISFIDKRKYWNVLTAYAISCAICFIIYLCYNVGMERQPGYGVDYLFPISEVDSISKLFDYGINAIYASDPMALNCFPSIHSIGGCVMLILSIFIPNVDKKRFPIWVIIIGIICGIGCILSTIFIKQHYFIDMFCGFILMLIVYILVCIIGKFILKKKQECII